MWVTCDELFVNPARDVGQVPLAPLLEQEREEVHLEDEVAQLVDELGVVTRESGFRHLVGLLDGVRDDRVRRLRAIPRAVTAQPLGELLQVGERLRQPVSAAHYPVVPVVSPVVVAAGANPGAYAISSLYFACKSFTQSRIVSFCFSRRSVSRIEASTSLSGVTAFGLMSDSTSITWKPNSVLTGRERSPVSAAKTNLSNGATLWPLTAVYLPPFEAELGSWENVFASSAKLAPSRSCS